MLGKVQKWWKSSPTSLMVTGNALEKYVRTYLKQLRPDVSVLDVGGGDGRLIRQIVKSLPKGRHHVLEPIPDLFLKLRSQLGHRDNLTLHNEAAAHITESVSYVDFLRGFSADPEPVRLLNGKAELLNVLIPCKPMDTLLPEEQFQLVVFRQGGSLSKAIEGGKQLISRNRPTLIFNSLGYRTYEVDSPKRIYGMLDELGYQLFPSDTNGRLQQSDFVTSWQSRDPQVFMAKAS